MAQNPIIYNDGGVHRFIDYVSQIPDFLKAEEDVVVLLQLMSDYINNAYRNIDTVEKFEFRFVAIDSNLTLIQNRVNKFINLLKRSEGRSERVLYLSKPQGNPRDINRPLYMEYITYNGTIDNLSSSIISIPLMNVMDGDKFYINFTLNDQETHSGVYIYDKPNNTLHIDPNGTSQDPFNDTANEPFKTLIGLAPRMMEFNVSDVSKLYSKKVATVGNLVYYEVFFTANITDIESVSSVYVQEMDIDGDGTKEKILIDYYNMINSLPSVYDEDFEINFASGCSNFEWGMGYGSGLFYARDLTQYERSIGNTNRDGKNKYVDPIFSPNTTVLEITNIRDITTNRVEVTVNGNHKLSSGDKVSIKTGTAFDGINMEVVSITSTHTFIIHSSVTGNESSGVVILRNLFFSKVVADATNFELKVHYNKFIGATDFQNGDKIARIKHEFDFVYSMFNASDVNISTNTIYPVHPSYFSVTDLVIFTAEIGSIMPSGIIEGKLYEIVEEVVNSINRKVIGFRLKDQIITAPGNGNISMRIVNRTFNTDDININENTIKVNYINGLSVGSIVRVDGDSPNISLPSPLKARHNYIIDEIMLDSNGDANLIKLRNITLTSNGTPGIYFDIVSITPDLENIGSVRVNKVIHSLSHGTITISAYRGDMISQGEFMRISSIGGERGIATAYINTSAYTWKSGTVDKVNYYRGDLVVYNYIRYRVIKSHFISIRNDFTPEDNENYVVDMSDIIERKKITEYNPYMQGMHRTYSLAFDEYPHYTEQYSEFADNLYIKKSHELTLKYGHEQREYIFNPRNAPSDNLIRNGFMEIIKSDEEHDAYISDVTSHIKAQTNEYKSLFGVNNSESAISSMNAIDNVVRVITYKNHLFKSGYIIEISGVDQTEYNGRFKITVINEKEFIYDFIGEFTIPITGISRLAVYTNDIILPIVSIVRSSTVATVVTGEDHGYSDGVEVNITGADQIGYNGKHKIKVISPNSYTYELSGYEHTPVTTSTEIRSIYSPKIGDFINVIQQANHETNGVYIVNDLDWLLYDNTTIKDPVTLFTRQNLFDISDTNPEIARELHSHAIKSLTYLGSSIVQVELYESHLYVEGTTVNITGSLQNEYNGRFSVSDVINATTFRYTIKYGVNPISPGTGKLRCYANEWYKFTLSDIQWQRKSNFNNAYIGTSITQISGNGSVVTVSTFALHGYKVGDRITIVEANNFNGTVTVNQIINDTTFSFISTTVETIYVGRTYKGYKIDSNQHKNNISLLIGVYDFTLANGSKLHFRDGDIVHALDQLLTYENGMYRVNKSGKWTRLDKRLVMKIRTANVDAFKDTAYNGLYENDTPYIYRTYSDTFVNNYIQSEFSGFNPVYKVEDIFASNFSFKYEKIENIDTAGPFHRQYDAKFDYNSISPRNNMKSDFKGVADMGYPLVEKFERLTYIKDPNVIDMEIIEYLARLMGYNITSVNDDIEESVIYNTDKERELALRRTIQELPQYYALKSSPSGLDMLLLTFGIVGELVTMWTRQESPYDELIPDYELRGLQYAENEDGKISNFIPTPHFMVSVEIEGNFDNQLLPSDERRITTQIITFKPINTVFDGIFRFLRAKLTANVSSGNVRASGRLKASVGFNEIVFDDEYENDCI